MYPKLTQRKNTAGEFVYTYVCKRKERSKREHCNRPNANGNGLDAAMLAQIKSLPENDSSFASQLAKSRVFYVGEPVQHGSQLEELRTEYAKNEQAIHGLVDSLGMAGESMAKKRILERIEELSEGNRGIEARIQELERQTGSNVLCADQFDLLRQRLSHFCTSTDAMSLEEKRTAVRTTLRKVVWDGVNAHAVLFGADEGKSPWGEDSK